MLKTPSAMDGNESLANTKPNPKSGDSGCLAQEIANGYAVKWGLFPTPTSSEIAHPARVEEQIKKGRTSLRERETGEAGPNGLTDYLIFNGLIPTVVTQGLKYCNEKGRSAFVPLGALPTPSARDWKGRTNPNVRKIGSGNIYGETLPDAVHRIVGMLPTPRSQGEEGSETRAARKGHDCAMSYLESNVQFQTGNTSQLNPLFVAEMMGFPPDWTVLPFLGGDARASKPTATQ